MSTSVVVKERPILFSGAMVRALLAGTKTQSRRIIPLRRLHVDYIGPQGRLNDPTMWGFEADDGEWYTLKAQPNYESREIRCRYGAPGDRLWVRETWASVPTTAYAQSDGVQQKINPADRWTAAIYKAGWERSAPTWKPSIHMPRWASRILLEITDVRVQRLQDISQDDAVAEGCDDIRDMKPLPGRVFYAGGPRDAYQILWESINGAGSWDRNEWVWCLTFKRVQP